jgi:hypothetical protein
MMPGLKKDTQPFGGLRRGIRAADAQPGKSLCLRLCL